ncbi:MAG: hypothetical protein ABL997_14015, partial [Planctomycetota bacterium]
MLQISWDYPVWKPAAPTTPRGSSGTVVVERERALPLEQAMQLVVREDRRPLLVMRECERCKGTDHALLSRSLDNEQTVLLTRWFHCVKLPPNVLEADHPLTAMFKPQKEGERIPHLFFVDPDGNNKAALPGDQSQTQLWETMFSYLERCYEGDAKKAVKELRSLLNQFDRVDSQALEIRGRIDKEIEKRGPDSDRLEKMESALQKLDDERKKLIERELEIRRSALLQPEPKAAPSSA